MHGRARSRGPDRDLELVVDRHPHRDIPVARAPHTSGGALDTATLSRRFAIRTSDAVAGILGGDLLATLRREAPNVSLRFLPEGDDDAAPLRDGRIDLDIGVIGEMGPEIRVQTLLKDRFVGVVRADHPLATGKVTAKRFVEHAHIGVSRLGKVWGPIDDARGEKGLARTTAIVVPSVFPALSLIARSDLVGAMSSLLVAAFAIRPDVVTFPLPVATPKTTIAQAWHPRFDADPAHQWLRDTVRCVAQARSLQRSAQSK